MTEQTRAFIAHYAAITRIFGEEEEEGAQRKKGDLFRPDDKQEAVKWTPCALFAARIASPAFELVPPNVAATDSQNGVRRRSVWPVAVATRQVEDGRGAPAGHGNRCCRSAAQRCSSTAAAALTAI